ncbi:beta-lactamase/transpeptidase-like protein [Pseudovirgaria hyperparasitica]|uniref:Beta-lactamase/transpeptidase-like protein n=1 Tax=Pseudovirgaria hyperparasitica TaxID=470096 RepID=A0A6A6W745_9PEZI|nr:beta-lactamase/transpeptidase-like protein [Pseudovirgaria hyperparasitica]KAF2757736.1 beta-lactamase/transpeptidase-like protein [Pseudovirgaria hyperparasitica]
MRLIRSLLILPCVVATFPNDQAITSDHTAETAGLSSDGPFDSQMSSFIETTLSKFHVPGISISFSNGTTTYAKGYGISRTPNTAATAETLYFGGSTTKSFTAASLLMLMERSANSSDPINLQTPISSLIREEFVLPDDYATLHVTLEDALSHRTGMPRHDSSYGGANVTLKDIVLGLRHLPMTAEVRTKFQYCNLMFITLSYVVEKLTDMSLGDFLKKNIWKPLRMTSTFFSLTDAQKAEADGNEILATSYFYNETTAKFVPMRPFDAPEVSGAGVMITNVVDYAKYLRAIMNEDPRILSHESYVELRKPRTFLSADEHSAFTGPVGYSFGWEITVYKGHQLFYHDGSVPGYAAKMMYIPEKNWTLALMSNTDMYSDWAIDIVCFELLDNLLEIPAKERFDWMGKYTKDEEMWKNNWKSARKNAYPSAPSPPLQTTLELSKYVGTYHNPGYRNLTLRLAESPAWWLRDAEAVLHMDTFEKTWKYTLDFEHVSGDYFIARTMSPSFAPAASFDYQYFEAEFRIGPDGRPSQVGLTLEAEMGSKKIWFDYLG